MISLSAKAFNNMDNVLRATERANRRVFMRQGAYVRRVAQNSLKRRKRPADGESIPSAPGKPPHTWGGGGMNLRRSILFDASPVGVVIGPIAAGQGQFGAKHEYGGTFRIDGQTAHYPARPFMGPALETSRSRLPDFWERVIK